MPALLARALRPRALNDPLKRKQLKKGLEQLSEEGAVQLFFDRHRLERDPILGAVGVLQFEVIQHRLESEYKVDDPPQAAALQARALGGRRGASSPSSSSAAGGSNCVVDVEGRPLVLFENDWALRKAIEDNPDLRFLAAVQPARSGNASMTWRRKAKIAWPAICLVNRETTPKLAHPEVMEDTVENEAEDTAKLTNSPSARRAPRRARPPRRRASARSAR